MVNHGNSDHNWITLVIEDKFKRLRLVQNNKKKHKFRIKDDQDWNHFGLEVEKHFPSVLEADAMSVTSIASRIAGGLYSGGVSAVGLRSVRPRSSMWSRTLPPGLVSELQKKRSYESSWKTLVSSSWVDNGVTAAQLSEAEELYEVQKLKVAKLLREHRGVQETESWKDNASFWSAVSGKVKQSTDINAVLSSSGVLKCEPDAIRVEVENHLSNVFLGSVEPVLAPPQAGNDHQRVPDSTSHPGDHSYGAVQSPVLPCVGRSNCLDRNPSNWLGRDFTAKEIKCIAKTLKCNKACGWDALPNEFIKFGPDSLFLLLSLLFNKMKNTGVFPDGWNRGRISLLHKRGLRVLLGNYRPITVLISLAGLYSKVLNSRLTEVVERHRLLGEVQGGFRKDRGCADNTFVLHSVLWKAKALNKAIHMAFLDISKGRFQ